MKNKKLLVMVAALILSSFWQFDAALSRVFQVREAQRIEVHAEAFNMTNSFRKDNPTVNINSNVFGQINSVTNHPISELAPDA